MINLRYISYKPGIAYGNLMFEGKSFPMKGGKFPKDHPFAGSTDGMKTYPSIGTGDKLDRLRAIGYYISCFPEGDGLCYQPPKGRDDEQIRYDIITTLEVTLTEIREVVTVGRN